MSSPPDEKKIKVLENTSWNPATRVLHDLLTGEVTYCEILQDSSEIPIVIEDSEEEIQLTPNTISEILESLYADATPRPSGEKRTLFSPPADSSELPIVIEDSEEEIQLTPDTISEILESSYADPTPGPSGEKRMLHSPPADPTPGPSGENRKLLGPPADPTPGPSGEKRMLHSPPADPTPGPSGEKLRLLPPPADPTPGPSGVKRKLPCPSADPSTPGPSDEKRRLVLARLPTYDKALLGALHALPCENLLDTEVDENIIFANAIFALNEQYHFINAARLLAIERKNVSAERRLSRHLNRVFEEKKLQ